MQQNIAHNLEEKPRTKDIFIKESFNFNSLLLSNTTLQGLTDAGFYKPSPIQFKAIPLGRCGLDLIVQAKSGTGKTAVFTIVALEMVKTTKNALQVLIFAPTREIAVQIEDVIKTIGKVKPGLQVGSFIGGLPIEDDIKKIKKCHIAVGAPGRLKHLVQKSHLKTDSIRLLVLDEADKLMERSFQSDINFVYHNLPERKQVIALSATYPDMLDKFLANYMQSPTFVTPDVENPILLGLRQFVTVVKFHKSIAQQITIKNKELTRLLSKISFTQCLVFFNSQSQAEGISNTLNAEGWNTVYISAAQSQAKRLKAVKSLKNFECKILLSTDLTARGIDAANVDLVINYDIPYEAATYLHRMGRAGRYGSRGLCVTIASDGHELKKFQNILGEIGGNDLSIAKLPREEEHRDVWEDDLNSFENLYGSVDDSKGENKNVELKKSVFDLKNNKIKNKSEDVNKITSVDHEQLSVIENINQEAFENDSKMEIQDVKNVLNCNQKIKEEMQQKYLGTDTESLLKSLASGKNVLSPNINEKEMTPCSSKSTFKDDKDSHTAVSFESKLKDLSIQNVECILNDNQKIKEDISKKFSGMDTESLLKSLASGKSVLSSRITGEEINPVVNLESELKDPSIVQIDGKMDEENSEDIINPASLYPWIPVEGNQVFTDTYRGVNLLELSDNENFDEEIPKDTDKRKRKRKQYKPMSHQKNNTENSQKKLTLLKNIALYNISQLLTIKDDSILNSEEFPNIVDSIRNYLNSMKENHQVLINDMLKYFQTYTCNDLLQNIAHHSVQWTQYCAQPLEPDDPMENIFKLGYVYMNKNAGHWIDALGDQYEPEDEIESVLEEDMDIEEEEEEEDYEDDFENATNCQAVHNNTPFEQNSYDYNNLEMMPDNDKSNLVEDNVNSDYPYNPTYASYFDHYRLMFENNALTFNDASSFNNYYAQWKSQVQSVRDYLQQNIYLQEMNNYQHQREQQYYNYPNNNSTNN